MNDYIYEMTGGGIARTAAIVGDSGIMFIDAMQDAPIALLPEKANEQHYEVPPEFFSLVLGQHAKYSCGYWGEGIDGLDQSEAAALRISCERAGIEDGMSVLDLGCGWGSLSLWIAEHFPRSHVTSISNSRPNGSLTAHDGSEGTTKQSS